MRKVRFTGIAAVFLIAGCASPNPAPPVSDDVERELVKSAQSIEKSLLLLSQSEHFEKVTARGKVTRYYHIPELRKEVSMQWNGDLEPAIAALVKMSGSSFVYRPAIGKRPQVPVMISLPADKRTIQELIENAAIQAGNHADVVIDTKLKIVQVRYVNNDL